MEKKVEETADNQSAHDFQKRLGWGVMIIILLIFLINCAITANEMNMGIVQYLTITVLSFIEERLWGFKYVGNSINLLGLLTIFL